MDQLGLHYESSFKLLTFSYHFKLCCLNFLLLVYDAVTHYLCISHNIYQQKIYTLPKYIFSVPT